ncbi:uncharacterized protein CELE_K11H12.8 [Caenorhabditis elegans]|uniref:Secreted protein n=1 Tax=Caenorhabditis elegans TaxID=6239 RepID=H2L016_CAEEL|nr:Secreted protein [Caenorhabditis elegans]CCD70978.1 Secreted protein [Caenorhabditis elegans]|eukprot:NP_741297.1 Uncharacterized protein CELE_K11H12.8 [Caenorhabditis elegans]
MLSRLTMTVPKVATFTSGVRFFANTAAKSARYGGGQSGFGSRVNQSSGIRSSHWTNAEGATFGTNYWKTIRLRNLCSRWSIRLRSWSSHVLRTRLKRAEYSPKKRNLAIIRP